MKLRDSEKAPLDHIYLTPFHPQCPLFVRFVKSLTCEIHGVASCPWIANVKRPLKVDHNLNICFYSAKFSPMQNRKDHGCPTKHRILSNLPATVCPAAGAGVTLFQAQRGGFESYSIP